MRLPFLPAVILALLSAPAAAQGRSIVDASAPQATAVTIYRDPGRSIGQQMERDWPRGFAMISETRTVTLPQGRSTIRFEGVAEGMVAVSAIVTGLPGGTIEKNRNADLLSPAALVDGTLGNRIQITRTNPGTGAETTQNAIVRTRADGGLVLQTEDGFEAVRCAGLPERLNFDAVPDGLSAQPVFSIDTRDDTGGTYTVQLSYIAWGFDWEANYVVTLPEGGSSDALRFDLVSWLTLLNDNGQTFANAELMAVAGRLNVTSDYRRLASPPSARGLQLTCYPLGSTAAGSPIPVYGAEDFDALADGAIMVTARSRMEVAMPMAAAPAPPPPPPPVVAAEENLGDLKLYRVPMPVNVAAQSLKQIAFLRREDVAGKVLYAAACLPYGGNNGPQAANIRLQTINDEERGLGVALPTGAVSVFERGPRGELLVGEQTIRDYAVGQEVEIVMGPSSQVFATCIRPAQFDGRSPIEKWLPMRAAISNANAEPVLMRLYLGLPANWQVRGIDSRLKDGQTIAEVTVPANETVELSWEIGLSDQQ